MPALKVLSGRQVRRILEEHGFVFSRQRGSHMILVRQLEGQSRTVSIPDHKELAIGTLTGVVRESGLDRALFEN